MLAAMRAAAPRNGTPSPSDEAAATGVALFSGGVGFGAAGGLATGSCWSRR